MKFFCIYLLVMPKYWVKNYFAHGRFPEVGQKQKTEKKKQRERAKVGDNNGQATHGARKPPGPKSIERMAEDDLRSKKKTKFVVFMQTCFV